MANDYTKYGLTYVDAVSGNGDDGSGGSTPGSPAGFTDSAGNFYTEAQADSLISNVNKGNYISSGGNAVMYIDPPQATDDARGAYAQLTRNVYDEWKNTFQPLEADLLKKTTYNGNPGVMKGIIANQTKKIYRNFDAAQRGFQRNAASYGLTQTEEQQQANESEMGLDRSVALVDMNNKARMYQKDLNRQILGTGASSGLASAMSQK